MHSRNRYREPYDFERLLRAEPRLAPYLYAKPNGHRSLDFKQPEAVRLLNRTLLIADYGLEFWDLPQDSLCPGVPGRLDYIHVLADLLSDRKLGNRVLGLDIGTGASLIYPILGIGEYNWRFVATDTDETALRAAGAIATFNPQLQNKVELRSPRAAGSLFMGVVRPGDHFAFSMCNPPFFASAQAAEASARLKWKKLTGKAQDGFNFGGRANELWTPGGEPAFLRRMIEESARFRENVGWFTTLISQKGYLKLAQQSFRKVKPKQQEVIELQAGAKARRVLAWRW